MLTKGHGHGTMHTMTRGCLAGTAVCFVSHTGEVFPCGYLPVSAGNVTQMPFEEIWNESALFDKLRDTGNLTGKCGLCEYKNVCMGCRARSYGETGDYLARGREVAASRPGDLLAVMSAGAYGFVMSSQYNSRPRPAEVMVKGRRWALVRQRETIEDLSRGEALAPWQS